MNCFMLKKAFYVTSIPILNGLHWMNFKIEEETLSTVSELLGDIKSCFMYLFMELGM